MSQIFDFTNYFSREDIKRWGKVYIELPIYLKINGWKCDVIIRLKKIIYGQAKVACLWYKKLQKKIGYVFCGDQGRSLIFHV